MTLREVLIYPHETLRAKAQPVTEFNEALDLLIEDMVETMYHASGIGLAANQIGLTQSLLVLDVSEEQTTPQHFINPSIVATAGSVSSKEGCLSLPDFRDTITRYETITVKAQDKAGQWFTTEAEGLLSICLQHEIDHLNGVMFTDHLTFLKKKRFQSWLKKR